MLLHRTGSHNQQKREYITRTKLSGCLSCAAVDYGGCWAASARKHTIFQHDYPRKHIGFHETTLIESPAIELSGTELSGTEPSTKEP